MSNLFFALGSTGLEVDDAVPGAVQRLIGYFPDSVDRQHAESETTRLLTTIGAGELAEPASEVPDEDWGAKWREHFQPVWPTPRMVIYPPWETVEIPSNGFGVAIEPRTAFGTGSHPTTRMALAALEDVIRENDRVLDVGTGSGILSIAAIKLGAGSVMAVDTDPLSTENVLENIALNEVSGIEVETRGISSSDAGYNISVANIISSVLTPLLPTLSASVVPGGHVVLGGLLGREASQFIPRVEQVGLEVVDETREAEWMGLITRTKA